MAYLVAFVLVIAVGLVAVLAMGRRVLAPPETYTKNLRGRPGRIIYCQHCDAVLTPRNWREHGVNCAKRPAP